jgi:hypothetical protein
MTAAETVAAAKQHKRWSYLFDCDIYVDTRSGVVFGVRNSPRPPVRPREISIAAARSSDRNHPAGRESAAEA